MQQNTPNSFLNSNLQVQFSISAKDILNLLNSPQEMAIVSDLWTGDGFYETNCAAVQLGMDVQEFCLRLRAEREIAVQKIRLCIDEWIDSGKRVDKEAAYKRTESRASEAALEAAAYWETSRIVFDRLGTTSNPRLLPRDGSDFENASWKARRIIALVLSSDLRLRIAKCRYEKCKRPYFLLNRPNKTYEHGMFCCIEHNRSATVPRRMQKRRRQFQAKLIEWAAAYVRRNGIADWQKSVPFKEKLAKHLVRLIAKEYAPPRDAITKNWVTRNWVEIQAKAAV